MKPDRVPRHAELITLFHGKTGLEIGGPSGDFKPHGSLPIYPVIARLDGCNFSDSTIWEGQIGTAKYHFCGDKPGTQFVSEATDLRFCADCEYDFVLSSNCLEHVANPVAALFQWSRVTKPGGLVVIIVPNKEFTFDHKRPTTQWSHILADFKTGVDEHDSTHLAEVLQLHDLSRDGGVKEYKEFQRRCLDNFQHRAMHHHVFDVNLLKQAIAFVGWKPLYSHSGRSHFIIGQKDAEGGPLPQVAPKQKRE